MFGSSDAFVLVLMVAIVVLTVVLVLRRDRQRSKRGLPRFTGLGFLNPLTWPWLWSHRTAPCSCPTGELRAIPRTELMRALLPDRGRYECASCHRLMLVDRMAIVEASRTRVGEARSGSAVRV